MRRTTPPPSWYPAPTSARSSKNTSSSTKKTPASSTTNHNQAPPASASATDNPQPVAGDFLRFTFQDTAGDGLHFWYYIDTVTTQCTTITVQGDSDGTTDRTGAPREQSFNLAPCAVDLTLRFYDDKGDIISGSLSQDLVHRINALIPSSVSPLTWGVTEGDILDERLVYVLGLTLLDTDGMTHRYSGSKTFQQYLRLITEADTKTVPEVETYTETVTVTVDNTTNTTDTKLTGYEPTNGNFIWRELDNGGLRIRLGHGSPIPRIGDQLRFTYNHAGGSNRIHYDIVNGGGGFNPIITPGANVTTQPTVKIEGDSDGTPANRGELRTITASAPPIAQIVEVEHRTSTNSGIEVTGIFSHDLLVRLGVTNSAEASSPGEP